jgi:uncharacterized protein YeaC (DUF1315 family)
MDLLEKEKHTCLQVLKQYHLKYNTAELKRMYDLYDYLNIQLKNETKLNVKLQIQEDMELLMKYLSPYIE